MISVQQEDFDYAHEYQWLRQQAPGKTGAIVCFSGLVREFGDRTDVHAIELEHYPGMTEKHLQKICDEAKSKWAIIDILLLHRVGKISIGEPIVLVSVWTSHRGDAFDACRFIMEDLKSRAPFWKKEDLVDGQRWVDCNTSGYSN